MCRLKIRLLNHKNYSPLLQAAKTSKIKPNKIIYFQGLTMVDKQKEIYKKFAHFLRKTGISYRIDTLRKFPGHNTFLKI